MLSLKEVEALEGLLNRNLSLLRADCKLLISDWRRMKKVVEAAKVINLYLDDEGSFTESCPAKSELHSLSLALDKLES